MIAIPLFMAGLELSVVGYSSSATSQLRSLIFWFSLSAVSMIPFVAAVILHRKSRYLGSVLTSAAVILFMVFYAALTFALA